MQQCLTVLLENLIYDCKDKYFIVSRFNLVTAIYIYILFLHPTEPFLSPYVFHSHESFSATKTKYLAATVTVHFV